MGVEGAPASPRDDDISPRDRSLTRWEEEEDHGSRAPAQAFASGGSAMIPTMTDLKEERSLEDRHPHGSLEDRHHGSIEDRHHSSLDDRHHGGSLDDRHHGGSLEDRHHDLDGTPAPYSASGSDYRGGSDSRYRHERRRSYDHGEDEDRGTTSLLIRHLKFTTAPNVVRSYFESVGPVKDVYLPLEFESGRPRGFGFVEFQHATDAQEALRTLNDTDLDGSCISISVAQHGRKTPSLMRARSSGYGRGGRRVGGYDRGRRGEPYSAPDRYERSPPSKRRYDDRIERSSPPRRRYDDRPDDRGRYDRYSSRSRGEHDSYYSRDV